MQMVKNAVRGITTRLGFEISRAAPGATSVGIEQVRPHATYAPWALDAEFTRTYGQVRGNTMVDIYRCYELWTLIEQVARTPGDIIEIGVWRGGSGALIARRAKLLNLDAKVYLCDTFRGMVKAGVRDPLYRGGELADTSEAIVRELVHDRMQLDNVEILPGTFPEETARRIPSTAFRLCHIDVDVYESAHDIVAWIWPKLPVGGMLVYDDYGFPTCAGIAQHVNEQRSLEDRIVIHNLNGHAIVVKMR